MRVVLLLLVALLAACAYSPPRHPENICKIFSQYPKWEKYARKAETRWGTPPSVAISFIHQESAFIDDAKPPRRKLLGFIPWKRSSARGYAQAKKGTWRDYKLASRNFGADRDDIADALDFIGWYNSVSHKRLKLKKRDAYNLYLAYHDGHGGYSRKTWRNKAWLIKVAKRVQIRASRYASQYRTCR